MTDIYVSVRHRQYSIGIEVLMFWPVLVLVLVLKIPVSQGIGIGIGIDKLILKELVLVLVLTSKGIHPQTCSRYPNGTYKP